MTDTKHYVVLERHLGKTAKSKFVFNVFDGYVTEDQFFACMKILGLSHFGATEKYEQKTKERQKHKFVLNKEYELYCDRCQRIITDYWIDEKNSFRCAVCKGIPITRKKKEVKINE